MANSILFNVQCMYSKESAALSRTKLQPQRQKIMNLTRIMTWVATQYENNLETSWTLCLCWHWQAIDCPTQLLFVFLCCHLLSRSSYLELSGQKRICLFSLVTKGLGCQDCQTHPGNTGIWKHGHRTNRPALCPVGLRY